MIEVPNNLQIPGLSLLSSQNVKTILGWYVSEKIFRVLIFLHLVASSFDVCSNEMVLRI